MGNCFFSIVIPVFQAERYLEDCLDSIRGQTERDWELLLVDDGSTDRSPQICDRYQAMDSRIHVLHKENEGPLPARLKGYALCRGEYVVSVDADDRLDREALSVFRTALQAEDADVLIFNYKRVDEAGVKCLSQSDLQDGVYDASGLEELVCLLLEKKMLNPVWSKVMRRGLLQSTLQKALHLMAVRSGDDLILSAPVLLSARKVRVIHDCLYEYRMVPQSITHSSSGSRVDDLVLSRTYLLEQLEQAGLLTEAVLRCFYRMIYETAGYLLWNCARSDSSFPEKRDFFEALTGQPLYQRSLAYRKGVFSSRRKRVSLWLFEHQNYRSFVRFERLQQLAKRRNGGRGKT
ncbi:MAG: glycosyltransferase [Clostridiales bacterium]|nr:glycosyltransferase [Clostridiales bacterium]